MSHLEGPDTERRRAWVADRRAAVLAAYDAGASTYDQHGYPNAPQRAWVDRLLSLTPPDGVVLDAPCGTGQYFQRVAAAGRHVVGADQSSNMLAEARRRDIAMALHHVGLQELTFVAEFDASMTIDAMENVAPEDWPLVLANLRRAVRPGAHLYVTVEEHPDTDFDAVHDALVARGLPAVRGEVVDGDVAGYHYYPTRQQVLDWIEAAGLSVVDEAYVAEDGWGYRHLLLRT